MSTSLLLDQTIWDLCLDASGNIALAAEPYSLAQDVACACRLFLGELWYDTTQGIPYFDEVLGHSPPTEFLKAQCNAVALTVPGVVEVQTVMVSFVDGELTGQVQFSDRAGNLLLASLSNAPAPPAPVPLPSNDRLDTTFILDHSRLA